MSSNALTVVPQYQDPQMLETIKQTVCKGATEAQFRMFIEVCKATGLNPFLKEIYYAPQIGVMASRDGYLRKANDHPQFDGMETRVERDDKNIPIKAVCSVWRKDRGHPVICEAYYSEYKKASQVWQQYPSAMIAKVAEVLALKRSFAINGVVTEEEVGEQGSKEAQKAYLAEKGLEPYAPGQRVNPSAERAAAESRDVRNASPSIQALIIEGAKMLDEPPQIREAIPREDMPTLRETARSIEIRQSAKDKEAQAILDEAQRDQQAKAGKSGAHGIISLSKLKEWKQMKDDIRSYTGTDEIYKSTLKAKGYEHCNEIQTKEHAISIWRVLGAERNRLKQEKENMDVLAHAAEVIGQRAFSDCLGVHGAESLQDALNLSGDAWAALLAELKELVDQRKGQA